MNHPPRVLEAAHLGVVIRAARRERGLNQADLAERLGVSRMTISRMEQGDAVSMATATEALSELGWALYAAPKFARVRIVDDE